MRAAERGKTAVADGFIFAKQYLLQKQRYPLCTAILLLWAVLERSLVNFGITVNVVVF